MKIAFLFSGQGSQYPGMMEDISNSNNDACLVFDKANQSLNRDIRTLCFFGTQEELNLTHNTQPCVLAADLAAYAAISSYGITPNAVAGFSLGEYAALVAAGVLDLNEVFPIVQQRADYMQEAVPIGQGAMAAVLKLSPMEVDALCKEVDGYVVPANYNCPGQIVVSGETAAVDELLKRATEKRIRAIKLPVSAPFHCEMMERAAEKLVYPLGQIHFCAPSVPVYMNVDAKVENNPDSIRRKLILQAKAPVFWEKTIRNMCEEGVDTFIELGPGKTLTGFVKKTVKEGIMVYNVSNQETLERTIGALKGI